MFEQYRLRMEETVRKFALGEITPEAMFDFERQIAADVRELTRQFMERVLNMLEADDAAAMPHDVCYRSTGFRRLNRKTRNARVATLFGTIVVWRYGYRDWQRDAGESVLFPLEMQLGLLEGATPRWRRQWGGTWRRRGRPNRQCCPACVPNTGSAGESNG